MNMYVMQLCYVYKCNTYVGANHKFSQHHV